MGFPQSLEGDVAEYLAKKARKRAVKNAKKLNLLNISGYANESNPFGDPNLNERFVWRKKIERDIAQGVPLEAYSLRAEKWKHKDRVAEVEKVKKRREKKAIEKGHREEEMALLARKRARAEFVGWEKEEKEFHLHQSKVRSEIRFRGGRAKPIDILNLLNPLDVLDTEINEPYMAFKGLTLKEIEELHEDIKLHLELDQATTTEYWEALLVICDWTLHEARKKDVVDRGRERGERLPPELLAEGRRMHSSIEADVDRYLHGKYYSKIESRMSSDTAEVVEYWEELLKRVQLFKAKAWLKEIHAKMLRKHLQLLEKPLEVGTGDKEWSLKPDEKDRDVYEKDAKVLSPELILREEAGSFSPELFHGDDNEEGIDPEEDKATLESKRLAVLHERRLQELTSRPIPPEDNFEKKALKAMGAMEEGNAIFGSNDEINLDSQVYWWHDKYYRPRKPKYPY